MTMTDLNQPELEKQLEQALKLIQSGEQEKGDQLIQKIAAEHPDHYLSLYGLGLIAAFMGNHDKAKHYFEQSITIEPEYALAHYNLGFCHQKLNQIDLMIKHFYLALQTATDEELELLEHVDEAIKEFSDNLPAGITMQSFLKGIN